MLDDEKAKIMADRLADTEDYDPEAAAVRAASGAAAATATAAVDALRAMGLASVGALGFLNPDNDAPARRKLLTRRNSEGREELFMAAGKLAMLAAPGGTGKTQMLFQLAVSVASGLPWVQTYHVTNSGPVLLILGEEDDPEMHRRIRGAMDAMCAWEFEPQISMNLHVMSMCGKTAGMTDREGKETPFYEILKCGLQNWPDVAWSLIILDPASRFLGPDAELDNAAATRWIEAAERLTQLASKPTVLFAHHANKTAPAGGTDQGAARGSSALTDGVRLQMNLDRVTYPELDENNKPTKKRLVDPTRVILRVVKSNYGLVPPPLFLLRDSEHGGFLVPDPFPPEPDHPPASPSNVASNNGAPTSANRNDYNGASNAHAAGGDNSDCD